AGKPRRTIQNNNSPISPSSILAPKHTFLYGDKLMKRRNCSDAELHVNIGKQRSTELVGSSLYRKHDDASTSRWMTDQAQQCDRSAAILWPEVTVNFFLKHVATRLIFRLQPRLGLRKRWLLLSQHFGKKIIARRCTAQMDTSKQMAYLSNVIVNSNGEIRYAINMDFMDSET
ncbi:hypothetical protein, partial [Brucella anthropi]|uniref:hypothetical protein n=1 Tax=Brucella anthropi TaxID=529 RepID=UPI003C7B6DE4